MERGGWLGSGYSNGGTVGVGGGICLKVVTNEKGEAVGEVLTII